MTCGAIQNESRPMRMCQRMSHCTPQPPRALAASTPTSAHVLAARRESAGTWAETATADVIAPPFYAGDSDRRPRRFRSPPPAIPIAPRCRRSDGNGIADRD
jgi:hypothetical protein